MRIVLEVVFGPHVVRIVLEVVVKLFLDHML